MRNQQTIPIIGMDARPLKRQATPGLCKEIVNLRPDGIADNPHWVPVPTPVRISDYQRTDIVQITAYKHYSVVLTENNTIQLLNHPSAYNGDDAAMIIEQLQLSVSVSDSITIDTVESGNIGVVIISKNNAPFRVFFIDEEQEKGQRFIDFEYPELPIVKLFIRKSDDSYSLDEYTSNATEGLLGGNYYWRYAFRIGSGNHIMHSKPLPISLFNRYDDGTGSGPDAKYFLSKLIFYFEGFEQIAKPANYGFWSKLISGVSVFITPRMADDIDPESIDNLGDLDNGTQTIDPSSDLANAQFYEAAYFPFIDYDDDAPTAKIQDRIKVYQEQSSQIPTNDTLEADNFTNHRQIADSLFVYNSRLFLGDTATDFGAPRPSPFNSIIYPMVLLNKSGNDLTIDFLTDSLTQVVTSSLEITNTSNVENATINAGQITATATNSSFALTVTYENYPSGASTVSVPVPFSVTVTNSDFNNGAFYSEPAGGTLVPYSKYSIPSSAIEIDVRYEAAFFINNKKFHRVTPEAQSSAYIYRLDNLNSTINFKPYGGYLFYPDNRVKEMAIYLVDNSYNGVTGGPNAGSGKIEVSASNTINAVSSATNFDTIADGIPVSHDLITLPGSEYTITPFPQRNYSALYRQTNRLIVSETNYPYSFQPENTYYFGRDSNKIQAMGVNALPVSEGQFGQFPVYVFTEGEIWALQQGNDPLIAFSNQVPVSLSHGISDSRRITNIGRSLAFIYNKNIYQLSGGRIDTIGNPIHDLLTGTESLAYYNNNDNVELWVISDSYILSYNLEFGRWFKINRSLKELSIQGNTLQSIDDEGFFVNEYDLSTNLVDVSLHSLPVHYGLPDSFKRLYYIVLRSLMSSLNVFKISFEQSGKAFSTTTQKIRPRHPSDYSYSIELEGRMTPEAGEYIHAFDTEFDARYGPRIRQTSSTPEQ